ncbi:PREDICTED: putative RING-H2 finger protein ATL21A [Tarenaya hassleriana]|uniref:putative RING-H2 finger protein ATL21A n=1 Tax=Tarenaya hassleriana TaxID=28532 RepID=UPI00053C3E04|nr:PREDICTED: putative RING-H2 finger protein ATL21A [Tarenaya hassleriana]
MTFQKQLFPILFFLFPLLHLSHQQNCPSSSCDGHSYLHVRFPFRLPHKQPRTCGYPGFNLACDDQHNTVLELPKVGRLFVRKIDYLNQQISLYDPGHCLAGKLVDFDASGSPFAAPLLVNYTFLRCPNEVVGSGYTAIGCLGNSTSSVLATSNMDLVKSMPESCVVMKTLPVPVSWPTGENARFSTELNDHDMKLTWDSPDCRICERNQLSCGLISNASLQVRCFYYDNPGNFNTAFQILKIVTLSVAGPAAVVATCVAIFACTSERFNSNRRNASAAAATVAPQPNTATTTGLDESTIESYKKVELGESRRLPGPNGIICPICLSEYASKDTVRCIPECEHCFHAECIDEWLRLHNSCPLCRNSPSPAREGAAAIAV